MICLGTALAAAQNQTIVAARTASIIPVSLQPSVLWTGEAGSGFVLPPADPVRMTAKPALRLITPPYQWFTDTLDVGVIAAANDHGSLRDNLGINAVAFHCEGNTAIASAPHWNRIETRRGPRAYFGWWARLRKPSGTTGHVRLYVEASANDDSMQKRVIGPFIFSPQNTLHDAEITVAPSLPEVTGQRYQSLAVALSWCKSASKINPLITITEPGIYAPGNTAGEVYANPGYFNITASVPGVTIGRPAEAFVLNGNNDLPNDRAKLHLFGPNLTLDFRYVGAVSLSATNPGAVAAQSHWLDGIVMTNSDPAGKQSSWGGSPRDGNAIAVIGQPWFTEVEVSNMAQPMVTAALVRGCKGNNLFADVLNGARVVLGSEFVGNKNNFWNDDRPAFSLRYNGAAATATISRTGGVRGTGGGVWTVTIGGTAYTHNTGMPPFYTGESRYFSELVAWLNTLPGVTANLLIAPNDRVASSGSLPGLVGQGFTATDFKATTLTVVSNFDVHSDWYQHGASNDLDNVIVAFNKVSDFESQILFLSPPNPAPRGQRDALFFGNIFHTGQASYFNPAIAASQWGRANTPVPASHVVIAHNSFVNQRFLIRNEGGGLAADNYCLMRNNTMPYIEIKGPAPVPGLTIIGEHFQAGGAVPTGATNVTVGGTAASLFAASAAGDFSPAGELLANLKPSALCCDPNEAPFPATSVTGALSQ